MSRSDCSQKDYGLSWSSQEWKSGDGEHDRSGQPDRNSWDSLRKVDPHRGEHLLGRTAHSARNEESIHDRTGQPVSENIQGKADFENFIMGSETTEFVNKVRNQVRIRQKRMSSIAENCTEHSIIWGIVYGYMWESCTSLGSVLILVLLRVRLRCVPHLSVLCSGSWSCLGHPQPPRRTRHGCTVGVNRDPPVCSRCPGSMASVAERQPYVRWRRATISRRRGL